MTGGEADTAAWAYTPARALGELWNWGGEPLMGMPPLLGDAWFAKKGRDLVHSLVYWAADLVVAPRADSSGEVVAWYEGPVGDAEEKRFVEGGEFALREGVSVQQTEGGTGGTRMQGEALTSRGGICG